MTDNRIFKQRNCDIGIVKLDGRLGLGHVRPDGARRRRRLGPAQVAALRMLSEFEFDIPVGKAGDCYDRYLVRMEEMRQSIRIIRQCLDKLQCAGRQGAGLGREQQGGAAQARRDEALDGSADPPLQAVHSEGFHVPAGEVYSVTETPKGEFGVYLISDGTNKPYKCKIRPPAFVHLSATDYLSRGHMLADMTAVIGSIDVVFGEVDR